ncbi:MAG: IS110 family transposase [Gammaproteobacteria bacterium]|nr:IS110 family transposase [Gammaproteobacteria bacterium]
MKNPNEVALLALDIGACKHAYVFEAAGRQQSGELRNEVAEIRRFLSAALKRHGTLRVLVEATGIYYLDLALIAHELGAQVMVVNPKAAHNFAKALQVRSKSDQIDAHTLLEFGKRMPFQAWTPPAAQILQLRYYGRHLTQLTDERTACLNRLHALQSTQASPPTADHRPGAGRGRPGSAHCAHSWHGPGFDSPTHPDAGHP